MSRILSIKDEQGNVFCDNDVAGQFVNHFQSFLGKCEEVFPIDDADGLYSKRIEEEEEAMHLIRQVSNDEIKVALFDIEDNKAPGPDGFTSKFFKALLNTVGKDLCNAVKEFFNNGKMLGEINTTLISLVPKCSIPIKITDYGPIACYNVVYKCVSKVLTNRLKGVLKKLVDENQSAFIEGRHISENIMLAQELMSGYISKKKVGRCAFKVD